MKKIVSVLIAVFILAGMLASCVSEGKAAKNKEAAEKHVNQQVYRALGLAPEKLTSEVIYQDGDRFLIVVKYYLSSTGLSDGAVCVYCRSGYAVNATSIMAPEYPFKSNINELKALFGI